MTKSTAEEDDGFVVIFRRWIVRDGKRIYPPKGKKAWPIRVKLTQSDD